MSRTELSDALGEKKKKGLCSKEEGGGQQKESPLQWDLSVAVYSASAGLEISIAPLQSKGTC